MHEQQKTPFYQKSWFIVLTLIIFFPVGLILMWMHTSWNKPVKIIVTVFFCLIAIGMVGDDEESEESVANESTEESEEEPEQEENNEPEESEESTEEDATEEPTQEETNENENVADLSETEDYIISIEPIEEEYTYGTEEDIQVFTVDGENHYRITLNHHGGLLGSNNLDRIQELTEVVHDENLDYDYLVFEILRTDNDDVEDAERNVYTRFNPEQAEEIINADELSDDTFEEAADFFVSGSDADVGHNIEAINYDDMSIEEMIERSAENIFGDELEELIIEETDSGTNVDVEIYLGDQLTVGTAVSTMEREITSFISDLHNYDFEYNIVTMTYQADLVDQSGNESRDDVLITEFSDETIKEINPDNDHIVQDNLESLSDYWFLHQAFID